MAAVKKILKRDRRSIIKVFARCVYLRCPACGEASIVNGPFRIKHHCPSCDSLFKREDGFFVGAIMANVVTTEIVILIAYVMLILIFSLNYNVALTALFIIGILFPIAFYHHSWSFWLGLDYLLESLPKASEVRSS